MAKSILTLQQKNFLDVFAQDNILTKSFYFSGGTCLSEFYLQHRFSEDLDFFSEGEFDPLIITTFLKLNKSKINYITSDFQQSFNRNLFFLTFKDKTTLKVEFTYYPFPKVEPIVLKNKVPIDSLKDICINKVFTVFQKPRGRDFYDLYVIFKKTGWNLSEIVKLARIKFDVPIDPLQLGGNFMKVTNFKDDPLVIEQKYDYKAVEDYCKNLAYSLKKEVII